MSTDSRAYLIYGLETGCVEWKEDYIDCEGEIGEIESICHYDGGEVITGVRLKWVEWGSVDVNLTDLEKDIIEAHKEVEKYVNNPEDFGLKLMSAYW